MRLARWGTLTALPLLTVLVLAAPASADSSLTRTPASGPVGTKVTVTYTANYAPQQCSSGTVSFSFDGKQIGSRPISSPNACSATITHTIPTRTSCGPNHVFQADFVDQNQTHDILTAAFTVTCPTKSPTPKPTPSRTPPATHSASPTPTPTHSPTAAPRSATPTPTVTPTAAATRSALPVPSGAPSFGAPPPVDGSGGASSTLWWIGGGLLALAGVGVGVGVLAPRGVGKPAVVGVVVGGLLGGGALAAIPTLNPPVDPAIRSTYVTSGDCSAGDIPVFGGYHAFDTRPTLYHFHPEDSSWNAAPESSADDEGNVLPGGPSYTLCVRVGRPVPHAVRERTVAGSSPAGSASCQVGESLLGGGFYYPWGSSDLVGTHPDAPARWTASDSPEPGDLPAISGHVYALCAELPDGAHTYATSAGAGAGGTATAHCFSGDAVFGGGWSGRRVRGSYPVDGGWTAELGEAGSAYALCYKPSRAFGLHASYVRNATASGDVNVEASCDGSDVVLGAGWVGGHGFDSLRHFEPTDHGWSVNLVQADGTTASAFVLCARPYVH